MATFAATLALRQRTASSLSISRTARGIYTQSTGLYGFEHLKEAKGFRRIVDEAIERSGELITNISRMPPAIEVVQAMDEISNTVCLVVDSAELCRHTHPNREFVEEATQASIRINDYLHFLNTNLSLYNAVKKAESEERSKSEAKRVAHSLRIDFEKGGIHLCAGKMERVNQLSTEIAELGREFNENIIVDPGYVDIFPASRIPNHVQHLLKPIYKAIPNISKSIVEGRHSMKERGFRIKTDPDTLNSVLRWTRDYEVRKMAYITGNSSPNANLAVLDKLISARHELAQIMGCKSYTEFAIRPNMATSPEVVKAFLNDLSDTIRYKANEEFKTIRDFMRQRCNEGSQIVQPWDETYYAGMMKSAAHNIDSAAISSYFPLTHCIEGLNVLVKSLFGANFSDTPLASGESWHPDVIKLSLCHPDEGALGYLYLDLYAREGKFPGCAHFAIQGGRRLSKAEYQLPVVALVCNFRASYGSTPLLNHWEVETLFHEFGHALHSLLSRTDYQHYSGTRVALELAETPSNLFEYYAWDYRVLKIFAKTTSGEVIPKKLVDALNGAKSMFAATELQRQIFYAMVDQELFGDQGSSFDTTKIVGQLKRQYTCWDHVEGTHWHTRFNHLINYGAGYYSYLYAKCFAATIWQQICHEDPLSPEAGSAIRAKFLQHGGAKDPATLLKELAGDCILQHRDGGVVPEVGGLCRDLNL